MFVSGGFLYQCIVHKEGRLRNMILFSTNCHCHYFLSVEFDKPVYGPIGNGLLVGIKKSCNLIGTFDNNIQTGVVGKETNGGANTFYDVIYVEKK